MLGVVARGAGCPGYKKYIYIAFVLFTRTSMMGLGRASCVVGGHFRKQKGFRYIASYSIRLVDSTSSPDFVFHPLMCSQGPVGKE